MTATKLDNGVDHFRLGLLFAVLSAFTFGLSGPFAKALMEAGWTPTAAVTARMAGGAVVMAIVASIIRPGWVREAVQHAKTVIAYGIVPVAGAQLFYFNAVEHLSVGVALLLEYTAPILVVGYVWITTPAQADQPDTGRRRDCDRGNHAGAQRLCGRSHQRCRRGVGTRGGSVCRVLLRDVG